MQFLKNLPALCKQHYEKILLGLAFVALGVAVWLLNDKIQKESEDLKRFSEDFRKRNVKGIEITDFKDYLDKLKQFQNPPGLNFSVPHNLFNPVKWQRRPDGTLIKIEKGTEVGPDALRLANIRTLNLIITLKKAAPPGYFMTVIREAHTNAAWRREMPPYYVKLNEKDRPAAFATFTLREIKGAPDDPTELGIELVDTNERGALSKDKPYVRVDGYEVDFTYPPENKTFTKKRLNDSIILGSDEYILVDIRPTEAVLSARSNGKKTTIR